MTNDLAGSDNDSPLFCDHCTTELKPGSGNLYVVKIEAVADPAPPTIADEDLAEDIGQQIKDLLARMEGISAQEAMDEVIRRVTLYLCVPCYRKWIENPTGWKGDANP